ncbi:MAG TPA: HEAT repeat domain-containing protein [Terriglobia bacterium]|nr:HEAT repeat domain-containing protein [Terriglobia bacterium]
MELSKPNVTPLPTEDEAQEARRPASLLIAQFFLFPLIIIGICVGVFVLFGYVVHEERSPESYLNDIQSHPGDGYFERNTRGQAAYGLSNAIVANKERIQKTDFPEKVLAVYEKSRNDANVRQLLALTLGQLGEVKAVPALLEGLGDSPIESKINALWALGAIGDNAAVPGVLGVLHHEDPAVRRMAAYVLGAFKDRAAVKDLAGRDLQVLLEDRQSDVRWNAAMTLAQLGDAGGADVLMQLLDYDYVEKLDGLKPEEKATLRVTAVELLTRLNYEPAREKVAALSQADPDLRVRDASLKAVESLKKF